MLKFCNTLWLDLITSAGVIWSFSQHKHSTQLKYTPKFSRCLEISCMCCSLEFNYSGKDLLLSIIMLHTVCSMNKVSKSSNHCIGSRHILFHAKYTFALGWELLHLVPHIQQHILKVQLEEKQLGVTILPKSTGLYCTLLKEIKGTQK